jgi:hypothetical protein
MSEGYIAIEVDGANGEKISLKRSDKPGALIAVTIQTETIHVEPRTLLLAVQNLQEG